MSRRPILGHEVGRNLPPSWIRVVRRRRHLRHRPQLILVGIVVVTWLTALAVAWHNGV